MPRRRLVRSLRFLIAAVLLLAVAAGSYHLRWELSHRSEKVAVAGIANFGRMNPHLYRGAQPTAEGFANLRQFGVDTVVRLSLNEEAAENEERLVRSLGMSFVNLPWSTAHSPSDDQVAEFLRLFRDSPRRTFFVHCKAGADRTGVFVATYRIAFDRWTTAAAIDEMKAFRFRTLFLPHLQEYVETFPAKLSSEPEFVRLETAAY